MCLPTRLLNPRGQRLEYTNNKSKESKFYEYEHKSTTRKLVVNYEVRTRSLTNQLSCISKRIFFSDNRISDICDGRVDFPADFSFRERA